MKSLETKILLHAQALRESPEKMRAIAALRRLILWRVGFAAAISFVLGMVVLAIIVHVGFCAGAILGGIPVAAIGMMAAEDGDWYEAKEEYQSAALDYLAAIERGIR